MKAAPALDLPYQDYSFVRVEGERIVCRAGSPIEPAAVIRIDRASTATEVLRRTATLDPEIRRFVSVPTHVEFPTEGGLTAHCFYYAPLICTVLNSPVFMMIPSRNPSAAPNSAAGSRSREMV